MFYDDPDGWEKYAQFTLTEARKWGLPVYPYLCPTFHPSNKELGGKEVPVILWERALNVCRSRADAAVLWGGFQNPWNELAAWWQITKGYL